MPSANTFTILPINALLEKYIKEGMVVIDPMARDASWGTLTNDIDPSTDARFHMDALAFLAKCYEKGKKADVLLLDPPYSKNQIDTHYRNSGVSSYENPRFVAALRAAGHRVLRVGGIAIVCGWNSNGMGMKDKYAWEEILLVAHGGTRNDTIVTVQRKVEE